MQISRLFEMVYLLMERGRLTAAELAEHFEVSVRTVYRDIELLSGAGIPIYAERGRGGGVQLMEHFVLDRSLLSKRDQDEILYALQSLKATRAFQGEELLSRLSGLFQRKRMDWIDVDFSCWGDEAQGRERFRILKDSILTGKVVEFTYYNALGEKTLRRVEPLRLCLKTTSWYLQAFCRLKQDFRSFRISRMENLRMTEASFLPRDLPVPMEAAGSDLPQLHLTLLFSPCSAFRVFDEFPPSQVTRNEDGSFLVSVEYPQTDWIYGFLLSFGENVKVIEPDAVRRVLRKKAEKIIQNCGDTPKI